MTPSQIPPNLLLLLLLAILNPHNKLILHHRRSIHHHLGQGMDTQNVCQEVYSGVVALLEMDLENT